MLNNNKFNIGADFTLTGYLSVFSETLCIENYLSVIKICKIFIFDFKINKRFILYKITVKLSFRAKYNLKIKISNFKKKIQLYLHL